VKARAPGIIQAKAKMEKVVVATRAGRKEERVRADGKGRGVGPGGREEGFRRERREDKLWVERKEEGLPGCLSRMRNKGTSAIQTRNGTACSAAR